MLESWAGDELAEDRCLGGISGGRWEGGERRYHQGISTVEHTEREQVVYCQLYDSTAHVMEGSMADRRREDELKTCEVQGSNER